jgi:hypothetical protein
MRVKIVRTALNTCEITNGKYLLRCHVDDGILTGYDVVQDDTSISDYEIELWGYLDKIFKCVERERICHFS